MFMYFNKDICPKFILTKKAGVCAPKRKSYDR